MEKELILSGTGHHPFLSSPALVGGIESGDSAVGLFRQVRQDFRIVELVLLAEIRFKMPVWDYLL